ncbi:hypothetical protein HPB47_017010 [Ixodes persulcatus]|uniref:Uncharacterized protein n=1 Tax=Ixodes persulcatus TaxID=34615 RepID=A0AC60QPE7_IXOPE|nr:hypothetical protein HPB47_017010 [Ixodes persulcatus]
MCLHQLKWSVLWEPHYSVQGKVMKPDLVATKGDMVVIIDVQVVGIVMRRAVLHEEKAAKYTEPPLVTIATQNFRGIWPKKSERELLSLRSQSDLKLMTIRCLKGGLQCFWGRRRLTTAVNTRG